jgi:hypothetical protein
MKILKLIFTITFFFFLTTGFAQTSFLKEAVAKLDKALTTRDTTTLKQLLHKDVSYGHSNAWVENKNEMISHLGSGKISYNKIENKDFIWTAAKDWATVRSTASIDYVLDGKAGALNLYILQVWIKTNRGWQLLARQSTKFEDKH